MRHTHKSRVHTHTRTLPVSARRMLHVRTLSDSDALSLFSLSPGHRLRSQHGLFFGWTDDTHATERIFTEVAASSLIFSHFSHLPKSLTFSPVFCTLYRVQEELGPGPHAALCSSTRSSSSPTPHTASSSSSPSSSGTLIDTQHTPSGKTTTSTPFQNSTLKRRRSRLLQLNSPQLFHFTSDATSSPVCCLLHNSPALQKKGSQ